MAVLDGDRPEVLENVDGNRRTPSVVGLSRQGERLVGDSAKAQAVLRPSDTIYSVKRFMGLEFTHADVQRDAGLVPYRVTEGANGEAAVWLGDKAYSPPEISSFILAAMKDEAEQRLGEEVTHAVITVPAWFNSRQREATRRAGTLAGFKVMGILPEPTAAALAYGIQAQTEEPKTLLVYDLGGGTFDVTVMLVAGGVFEDLAKRGDNHLGGDDFDQKIMDWVIAEVRRLHGVDLGADSEALQKLKAAAETAKISLSRRQRASITIPAVAKRGNMLLDVDMEITRDQFAAMVMPMVRRTIELVQEAIEAASLTPDALDHLLLVGGSTLAPVVEEELKKVFGPEKILRKLNPMECVAMGAAVQTAITTHVPCPRCQTSNPFAADQCQSCGADLFEEVRPETECPHCHQPTPLGSERCIHCQRPILTMGEGQGPVTRIDRLAHSIGVQTVGDRMEIVIPANTIYPIPGPERADPVVHYFRTQQDSQAVLRAPVYEGENGVASANDYLGPVEGQLPPGLKVGTEVQMEFRVDDDGIVYVTATIPTHPDFKVQAQVRIGQRIEQIEPAPRPNQWKREARDVLGRAEWTLQRGRAYLTPQNGGRLTRLINELEVALEQGDEAMAVEKTAELSAALNALGGLNTLILAEAMSESPRVAADDQDDLERLLRRAQYALRADDRPALGQAMDGLAEKLDDVFEKLPPSPVEKESGAGDDWMAGLLRGRQ
jgi:molecular chaperone DnaK (HSP70)